MQLFNFFRLNMNSCTKIFSTTVNTWLNAHRKLAVFHFWLSFAVKKHSCSSGKQQLPVIAPAAQLNMLSNVEVFLFMHVYGIQT